MFVIDNIFAAVLHKIFYLRLNRCCLDLYENLGSWEEIWKLKKKPAFLEMPAELWDKYQQEKKKISPWKLAEERERAGIRMITRFDPGFSPLLLQISEVPCILYYCGDISLITQNALAVVGARRATRYGLDRAGEMSGELARHGLVIVSGMARGIDAAAHEGVLAAGGKTIAVLGSGLDVPYPRENISLFNNICRQGLVLSEYPPGTAPLPANFPVRNRIISGLALGVFVVEGKAQSGSLITADCALEQGKDVFALPGPVNSANSIGPLRLIQQGAKLVIYPEDILEELGMDLKEILFEEQKERKTVITPAEKRILEKLFWEPVHVDNLLRGNSKQEGFYENLLKLELKGLIRQLPGKYYVRV